MRDAQSTPANSQGKARGYGGTVLASASSPQALLPREIIFGLIFSATSGAAIIAHAFGPVSMSFTAPFVVLPSASVLVGAILLRRHLHRRLHEFSGRLFWGAVWGLMGTLCYDAIRPALKWIFDFQYSPYRAMPMFGALITRLPQSDPLAIFAGWLYHFWNGAVATECHHTHTDTGDRHVASHC